MILKQLFTFLEKKNIIIIYLRHLFYIWIFLQIHIEKKEKTQIWWQTIF